MGNRLVREPMQENYWEIPLLEFGVGEFGIEHAVDALDPKSVRSSKHIRMFEDRLSKRFNCHCVLVSSGTAAIHLGLIALGVGIDDEVVVPTQTFVATCNPVLYQKARPILMDSSRTSWTLNPDLLGKWIKKRAKLGRLPKAIVVVDLFGHCAEFQNLREVCNKYELPILEDAAHSLGGSYRGQEAGTLGDIGVFSLNSNKIISGGGGGILLTKDSRVDELVRCLQNQGKDEDNEGFGEYLHSKLGFNYRLPNILAGVGLAQLPMLEARLRRKRELAMFYSESVSDIPGLEFMPCAQNTGHANWLNCVTIDEELFGISASNVIKRMLSKRIEVRPIWKPLHEQKLFEGCEVVGGAVAEGLHKTGICLPSSSEMSLKDSEKVVRALLEGRNGCS